MELLVAFPPKLMEALLFNDRMSYAAQSTTWKPPPTTCLLPSVVSIARFPPANKRLPIVALPQYSAIHTFLLHSLS